MFILLLIILLVSTGPAHAATYYVATTGSDSNNGTSTGTPWRTVAKATSTMVAGDTTYVRAGNYSETQMRFGVSASQQSPIKLLNYPGEAPKITCVSNTDATNRILIQNNAGFNIAMSWITISGFEITNCYNAIKIYNADNLTISNNWIHDNGGSGLQGNGLRITVTHNRINNNGDGLNPTCRSTGTGCTPGSHGMYLNGRYAVITNNVIYDNLSYGIQQNGSPSSDYNPSSHAGVDYAVSHDWLIANNTIAYQFNRGAIVIWGANCNNTKVYNNIMLENGVNVSNSFANGVDFVSTTCTGILINNNIMYATSTGALLAFGTGATNGSQYTKSGNMENTTSPGLKNASSNTIPGSPDFTLAASSAAIDAGTTSAGLIYNGSTPDIGAFETFVFAACEVPSGSATKIRVTFTNNDAPPLLPASGATTFTARKNGSSNALSGAVTRIGDNILEITVTNSYAGGDTADISWSSGNLTNSSLIGNSLNQGYIQTLSNQSCTNNISGSSATLTQARYEFHDAFGPEDSPTVLPQGIGSSGSGENFSNYKVRVGGKLRLRFAITCGVSDCPPTGFFLYYSLNGGSYTAVPNAYTADNIQFCGGPGGSTDPVNGTPTTNQLSTGGTFIAGGLVYTSNAIPTVSGLNTGFKTELEYCIAFDTDAAGTYDFRVYAQNGNALDTYTVTPRLTITTLGAGGSGM